MDEVTAENTERFIDIKVQKCHKRSKWKNSENLKGCLHSKFALRYFGFNTASMSLSCSSPLIEPALDFAHPENSSPKHVVNNSQNLLS